MHPRSRLAGLPLTAPSRRSARHRVTALLALLVALAAPAAAQAVAVHPKLIGKVGYGSVPPAFARTADGTLHVALQSNTNWGNSFNGVGTLSISSSGHVGAEVQALNWGGMNASNGVPGLAVLPSGALEATFGGSPSGDNGPWGISSTDGGATWSAPVDVGSGSMEYGDGYVPLAVSGGTPVLAAGCCGGIVVQQGFGLGAPTYLLTNSSDNVAGNTDLGVDAKTGAVVASWTSGAGSGGIYMQQIAPAQGAVEKAPIPSQYGAGIALILAARDSGPGVFAAYPADYGNTTHIRLMRYGGGSVAVGSVKGLHANVWGAATGNDGRIWVIWYGTVNGQGIMAVTRSNRAVTRFEPVQLYRYDWSYLFTFNGDGRLGPLDLLIGGTPETKVCCGTGGIYYARFEPVVSAKVTVTSPAKGKFKLSAVVTDAGDPVKGAIVKVGKTKAITGFSGAAALTIAGSSGTTATVHVNAPGYRAVVMGVKL